ncbi:RNA methyltransferase [Chelatococcus sp. SYSU_G07232]|uniref:RNA methyltransferase n=1 Tax=Chelatococcus albus TaxID=3047466 RepID=A0ABT7AIY9_9HYPH|nr:RNA methyltransferase [Chelatococcus sp. SYSU_G07232]MDJ1159347.1 RNA methyltransferase [Chelatococcus sp. SYSU_G07232]
MPQFVPVDDPADPRVARYVAVRERDLVGHGRRFIAEGEVVLRHLLSRRRFALESLLVAEKRLGHLADELAQVPAGVPVYVASQGVMDAIVGFHIHRGVLAIGLRGEEPTAEALLAGLGPHALVVALVGIANHDNMGGIFRNAAAFGADAVLIDETSCDPLYRKAIRVSVGASLIVPFAREGNGDGLVDLLARHGFEAVALSPRGRERLSDLPRPGRVALLLGAEGPGLPEALLARTRSVRIPMAAGFDSLNVATTSGIALHHLAMQG